MTFIGADDVRREELDWGILGWVVARDTVPGARQLTVLEVTIEPGGGHDFHRHPDQEEIIYVREGSIEQWIGHATRELGPGDTAFIPQGEVHASFVPADASQAAKVLVVLGPSVGEQGYEAVDVSTEEPWASLRG